MVQLWVAVVVRATWSSLELELKINFIELELTHSKLWKNILNTAHNFLLMGPLTYRRFKTSVLMKTDSMLTLSYFRRILRGLVGPLDALSLLLCVQRTVGVKLDHPIHVLIAETLMIQGPVSSTVLVCKYF